MVWQASGESEMKQGTIYDHGLDIISPHEVAELQEHLPRETELSMVTWAMSLRRVTADTAQPPSKPAREAWPRGFSM